MYRVVITGFKTKAQAEAFMDWYEGQGEQDAWTWFECRKDEGVIDVDSMNVKSTGKWEDNTISMEIDPQ